MPTYSQAGRPLQTKTPLTPEDPDAVLLEKLSGSEAISEPFLFRLELLAEEAVDFKDLLNQEASVSLALSDGATRYFSGIIRRLTQVGRVPGPLGKATFIRYRAELVPALWRLTRRLQSRIFENLSVPDILDRVLNDDWQLNVKLDGLIGTYPSRNYCVQYQESDLAFVCRLMEEEGIAYFFTHQADGHQMVLADTGTLFPDLGDAIFHDGMGDSRTSPRVVGWEKTQDVRSSIRCALSFQIPDNMKWRQT